jgi:hypothetical protein
LKVAWHVSALSSIALPSGRPLGAHLDINIGDRFSSIVALQTIV